MCCFWAICIDFGRLLANYYIQCSILSKPSGLKTNITFVYIWPVIKAKKKVEFYHIFHIFNHVVLTRKRKNPIFVFFSVSFMVRHYFEILNSKIGESRGRWNTLGSILWHRPRSDCNVRVGEKKKNNTYFLHHFSKWVSQSHSPAQVCIISSPAQVCIISAASNSRKHNFDCSCLKPTGYFVQSAKDWASGRRDFTTNRAWCLLRICHDANQALQCKSITYAHSFLQLLSN